MHIITWACFINIYLLGLSSGHTYLNTFSRTDQKFAAAQSVISKLYQLTFLYEWLHEEINRWHELLFFVWHADEVTSLKITDFQLHFLQSCIVTPSSLAAVCI